MTYAVQITGFKTQAQAEEFIKWYEGQGEQDSAVWFDVAYSRNKIDVDFMPVDCEKTFPLTWNENTIQMVLDIQPPEDIDE